MGRGQQATTNYDPISEQYKRSKEQPWRVHVEAFTLARLTGDPAGKSVTESDRTFRSAENPRAAQSQLFRRSPQGRDAGVVSAESIAPVQAIEYATLVTALGRGRMGRQA